MSRIQVFIRPLLLVALTLVVGSPVTAPMAQETPKRGGTFMYALSNDPPHFDIVTTNDLMAQQVAGQIFSQLIRLDVNGKASGDLAESWNIAPDGMTYTFHIRKNVRWHDGKPLTAEDIRWALTEINMKYNPNVRLVFASVSSVEAPDDSTLVIRMKTPYAPFMPWGFHMQWIYPKHLYQGTDPRQNERNYKNPIGTGPFMLKEWVRGSHVVMERNPNYFKPGQPYLDRVVAKIIPDAAARVVALETGEVDYISIYGLPSSAVPDLRKNKDVTIFTHRTRVNYGGIMAHMNLRNDYLKVKEVRQALSYAIDRKLIVERAVGGLAVPASSPMSSLDKTWYNPAVASRYSYDPKKAESLLDQAGFKRGAGGKRFGIRITYATGGEGGGLQSAAEIMRENFRAVGIDLILDPKDYTVWMESAFLKWDFDLSMGSIPTGPDPAIAQARYFVTKNIQKQMGRNLMGYSNPKVDTLFDAGEREINQAKRVEIYHEVQKILVEDLPVLWIWDRVATLAYRNRVKGEVVGGAHFESFDNIWVTDRK